MKSTYETVAFVVAAMMSNASQAQIIPSPLPVPEKKNWVTPTAQQRSVAMSVVEVKGDSSSYDPRRDETAGKIVVPHAELVRYGDSSIVDALKRIPGLTVNGGGARGADIRLRGLGSGYTQVLLNGERPPAGFTFENISPELVERVEVVKAANVEFSANSIAGTVNIVLRRTISKAQKTLKIQYGHRRTGPSPSVSGFLADKVGDLSYSLASSFNFNSDKHGTDTMESVRSASNIVTNEIATEGEDFFKVRSLSFTPRLTWTVAPDKSISWQTFFTANERDQANSERSSASVGVLPQYRRNEVKSDAYTRFLRTELNGLSKFDNGAQIEVKAGLFKNSSGNNARANGYTALDRVALARISKNDQVENGFSTTGKYSWSLLNTHFASVGWDVGLSKSKENQTLFESSDTGVTPIQTRDRFFSAVSRQAFYSQDDWKVDENLSLYTGLRWERVATSSSATIYPQSSSSFTVWSPVLQGLWRPSFPKGGQARFALSRTYRAPASGSLIPSRAYSTNNSALYPDSQGNPDLQPELATGFDTSYEQHWNKDALISFSASTRSIDGIIRRQVTFEDGRWLGMPVNDGKGHTASFDVETKFPLKSVVATAPEINVRMSVSKNWSSVDKVAGPDNRLEQQIPLSARIGVDYKIKALSTGANLGFRQGGLVRVSDDRVTYQAYRRELDAYALWKVDQKTSLRFAVGNIFVREYISDTTFTDANDTIRRRSSYPGTIYFGATLEVAL